jgi:hypothetical protein
VARIHHFCAFCVPTFSAPPLPSPSDARRQATRLRSEKRQSQSPLLHRSHPRCPRPPRRPQRRPLPSQPRVTARGSCTSSSTCLRTASTRLRTPSEVRLRARLREAAFRVNSAPALDQPPAVPRRKPVRPRPQDSRPKARVDSPVPALWRRAGHATRQDRLDAVASAAGSSARCPSPNGQFALDPRVATDYFALSGRGEPRLNAVATKQTDLSFISTQSHHGINPSPQPA